MQSLPKVIKKDKVIIAALFKGKPCQEHQNQINELEQLVVTLGGEVIDVVTQYKNTIDPKFFLGKGKLDTIYRYAKEKKCNYVVINNDITASHIKNIQAFFKEEVFVKDRVGVILDIFKKHARTRESKTQVKLAQLEYHLPRLTRQWTHLERQMGGIGTRGGPGETQIEVDRRLIREQIIKLKKELLLISKRREVQKKNRKNIFRVSLVGYTNAGKSTIMKKMTNKDIYIKDELFATLETKTKKILIDKNNKFILSDTVGFIRSLPDNLIASFRSTLGELEDSDLLLKIVDASSDEYANHLASIDEVLHHLNISKKLAVIIFNKIDKLNDANRINKLKKIYPQAIFISAANNLNIPSIFKKIKSLINKGKILEIIKINYNNYNQISKIYKHLEVKERIDKADYVQLKVYGKEEVIKSLINKIKE
jgi:GTP-binding protein HflX